MSRILLTGRTGRLGHALYDLLMKHHVDAPSSWELDITQSIKTKRPLDLVIHCAGYTDVLLAETEREACFDINVKGTFNMVEAFKCPFVFISTEYAKNPTNWYATTKSLAEQVVQTHPNHLIIRTLFKTRPFPYPTAYTDQYTQGDYLDVIAPLIAKEALAWEGDSQTIYVGTGRKTMFELASKSRKVEPISIKDIEGVTVPADYL